MSSLSYMLKIFFLQRLPHILFMSFFVLLAYYAGMVFQQSGGTIPQGIGREDFRIFGLIAPVMMLGLVAMRYAPAIKRDKNMLFGVFVFTVGAAGFFLWPVAAMQLPEMKQIASLTVMVVSVGFVISRTMKLHQPVPHEAWVVREKLNAPAFVVKASVPKRPNRAFRPQSTPSGSLEDMLTAGRGMPSPGLAPRPASILVDGDS